MFANNKHLLHLDMSHCDLSKPECFKMNEGLLGNHTILGLHMTGNQLDTDPNGFITDEKIDAPQCNIFIARMDENLETGKLS